MTTGIQTAAEIFADARRMYSEALKQLAAGDIRDLIFSTCPRVRMEVFLSIIGIGLGLLLVFAELMVVFFIFSVGITYLVNARKKPTDQYSYIREIMELAEKKYGKN